MPATVAKTKTVQYRDFSRGMNQTDARPALRDNEAFWLENVQPIGRGALKILPAQTAPIITTTPAIAKMFGVTMKIGGVQTARLICFFTDGSASAINPVDGTPTSIGAAGTFTTSARIAPFQDTPLLIGDPTKGYFSWDGTTLIKYPLVLSGTFGAGSPTVTAIASTTGLVAGMHVLSAGAVLPNGTTILSVDSPTQITLTGNATNAGVFSFTIGAGAPSTVIDLTTFEGRTILLIGARARQVTAPGSYTDFQLVDGALVAVLTDSNFAGDIKRVLSALEVVWQMGVSAVNALSNIQIAGGVTTFSDTNIVSNVGTPYPSSVSSFFRTFLFLTQYGVYAIVGATPQKLSDQLDLLFPQLSYGSDVPAGVVSITNVFVWAVLVTYLDPATNATRPLLLCLSRNAWFVASQGPLVWVASVVNLTTGIPELWGTDGHNVYKCFGDATGLTAWKIMTKFYDFDEFTRQKQALRFAVELQGAPQLPSSVSINAVAVNDEGVQQTIPLAATATIITFVGSGPITFVGSGPILWSLLSINRRGPVNSMAGDYIGFNLSGSGQPFIISGLAFEITPQGEWT